MSWLSLRKEMELPVQGILYANCLKNGWIGVQVITTLITKQQEQQQEKQHFQLPRPPTKMERKSR